MKTSQFTNFTGEDFIGYWDGKSKKFSAGTSLYMPSYLAAHFAKHLVNRELLRKDGNGNPIYKDGEKMTSPKNPEQVPLFMELFNKAYKEDRDEDIGNEKDDVDSLISSTNKNREEHEVKGETQDTTQPQVIVPPDYDEDDEDESFGGSPVQIDIKEDSSNN